MQHDRHDKLNWEISAAGKPQEILVISQFFSVSPFLDAAYIVQVLSLLERFCIIVLVSTNEQLNYSPLAVWIGYNGLGWSLFFTYIELLKA